QLDPPTVFFKNSSDDCEAQAGALFPRRHIRLEEAAAVFLRQANSVVDDIDDDVRIDTRRRNHDPTPTKLVGRHRRDGFAGVLDDVGQSLWNKPAIEARRHRVFGNLNLDIDIGVAYPLHERYLAHGVADIVDRHHRLRHPRKARELVDHASDIVDLAYDRIGALFEYATILDDRIA